jgi:hypothetical protein
MTELLSEKRISFSELARRESVHVSTIWRWALHGCKGHKLESFSIGGKKFTTLPAYERWFARINGEPVVRRQTPQQRERQIVQAEQRAATLGV